MLTPAPGVPSVDQVLNKYLQAIGGAADGRGDHQLRRHREERRLSRVRWRRRRRDRRRRRRTSARRTSAFPSTRTAASASDLRRTNRLDRDAARGGAEVRAGRQRARRRAAGRAARPFPRRSSRRSPILRVGLPTTIDDKDVTVRAGNGPNGTLATLYFDDTSGLLVRMVRHGRSPIGRVPTQVDYSDYRDVGGIKFPFHWTFAWLDGRDNFEFSDVKLNVPIDAAKFGQPDVAAAAPTVGSMAPRRWRRRSRCCGAVAVSAPARRRRRPASTPHLRPSSQARTAAGGGCRRRSDRRERCRIRRGVQASQAGPQPTRATCRAASCRRSYRSDGGEYFYTLDVPDTYDPARKYQVRVQLHGGVGRIEDNTPRDAGSARPAGRRRADLRHAVRLARRAVVERPPGGRTCTRSSIW